LHKAISTAFAITIALGLPMAAQAQSPGETAGQSTYQLFEFSSPAKDHEAEFEQWYATRHIPAVQKLRGIKSVQRYRIEQAQRAGTPYPADVLVIQARPADEHALASKLYALLSEAGGNSDSSDALVAVFSPLGEKLMAKDVQGTSQAPAVPGATELKDFHLWAFVNAQPDHDAEFNKGYTDEHFPDVIRNPGIQWGQRAKLVDVFPASADYPHYLAEYDYSAYDIPAANAEVNHRLAEHITRPIPFSGKGGHTWYAQALGPVLPGNAP